MAPDKLSRYTAIFCLLTGMLNLIAWTLIIASGQVTDFEERTLAYIFHWISEFTTALLLLVAAVMFLRHKPCKRTLLFTALGFLLISIGGAFVFYLEEFEPAMFTMSAVITGLTIIFIILNYTKLQDLVQMTAGLGIYAMLNILGDALESGNSSVITMTVPTLLFLIVMVIAISGREMFFRRFSHERNREPLPPEPH